MSKVKQTSSCWSHQAAAAFHRTRFCETLLLVGGNVHLVTQAIPSLLLHDDKSQHEDVGIELAGWVDSETRFELAFEYARGDVWRTVLIYGFDTSSTDLKELKGGFDNSQPRNAKEKHTWNPVLLQNFHTYSSSSFPMKHLELDRGSGSVYYLNARE
jgi:hypothetical protein